MNGSKQITETTYDPKSPRTEILTFRLTLAEMKSVAAISAAAGKARSEWARDLVLEHSEIPPDPKGQPVDLMLLEQLMELRLILLYLLQTANPTYPAEAFKRVIGYTKSAKVADAAEIVRVFLERQADKDTVGNSHLSINREAEAESYPAAVRNDRQ